VFTVILPAAGKGTRLNLPYPKELHRILPGISLIDFSLDHVRDCSDLINTVVTVIDTGKESVSDYVEQSLRTPVATAYFDTTYTEWPGSIRSAEAHFGEFNIVLLPDSVVEPAHGDLLVESFAEAFATGADVVFAYAAERRPDFLSRLGALHVEGSHVTAFCDKPEPDHTPVYNAFWSSFAFRRSAGPAVLDLMMRSVARHPVDLASLGLKVAAFPVAGYTDLGTWRSISNFLSRQEAMAA
jgi:NDP-sugar pyrophosphorylase family protein